MKYNLPDKFALSSIFTVVTLVATCFVHASGQSTRRNSPFAPNPKGRTEIAKTSDVELRKKSAERKTEPSEPEIIKIKNANVEPAAETPIADIQIETSAGKGESDAAPSPADDNNSVPPVENVKADNDETATKDKITEHRSANLEPSEIYKVGVGDILYISLQNAPAKESTYFTVLVDGTIDYPLAGDMISVKDMTAAEIEDVLKEKIKLYQNPQVSVKVREHNSHHYTVLGLVEKPGEKVLQREAYPLLIVRAEALVKSDAARAVIKRNNSQIETVDLKDVKSDDVLIYAGDAVEFVSSVPAAVAPSGKQFFYIGGEIVAGGQKDYLAGMTLTQAILASGGLKKLSVKRVVVRRKNEAGLLSPISYDLKSIKDGKTADPEIKAGDTIEVGN